MSPLSILLLFAGFALLWAVLLRIATRRPS